MKSNKQKLTWLEFSCPRCRASGEKADTYCNTCFGTGVIKVLDSSKNNKNKMVNYVRS